jgi:hypothetical protein
MTLTIALDDKPPLSRIGSETDMGIMGEKSEIWVK